MEKNYVVLSHNEFTDVCLNITPSTFLKYFLNYQHKHFLSAICFMKFNPLLSKCCWFDYNLMLYIHGNIHGNNSKLFIFLKFHVQSPIQKPLDPSPGSQSVKYRWHSIMWYSIWKREREVELKTSSLQKCPHQYYEMNFIYHFWIFREKHIA